jgi:hypothetical protein
MRTQPVSALALISVTILLNPGPAGATLIELDDAVFGPGSITRDTDTGLDWLDVPISAGRSYDDVSVQFGTGGDFDGFRYATKAEVQALMIGVGITSISGSPPNQESYAPAVMLQGLVGETTPMETLGVNGDVYSVGSHFGTRIDRADAAQTAQAEDFEVRMFDDEVGSFGHWLVRPVPEPSTLLLVASGLTAMARRRRTAAAC